jgi:phosphoribosylanthranilate isomerase
MVTTVGLFVNESPARIRELIDFCGLDTVQLHGDEEPEQCCYPSCRVIKAVRLTGEIKSEFLTSYPVAALLLDAYAPDKFGGTGRCCDWQQAAIIAAQYRVILAGGLTPENIAEAVRKVRPYGVDVSSGVEKKPGQKDPDKVARFIHMAREAL